MTIFPSLQMGAGFRAPATVLFTLVLAGCALFYRDPTVTIADVRVLSLGFTGGTAEVVLEVENPNRFDLEVRGFDYRLEIREGPESWTELAQGVSEERVRLQKRSTDQVALTIPFRFQGVGSALRSWLQTGEIGYRMQGTVRARGPTGEVSLPFRSQGTLKP